MRAAEEHVAAAEKEIAAVQDAEQQAVEHEEENDYIEELIKSLLMVGTLNIDRSLDK